MIDITRFAGPHHVLAMANRLAEMQKQTALPHTEPFRSQPKVATPPLPDRTVDLIAASLAAGMIAVGGKAVTPEEAVRVHQAVREAIKSSLYVQGDLPLRGR